MVDGVIRSWIAWPLSSDAIHVTSHRSASTECIAPPLVFAHVPTRLMGRRGAGGGCADPSGGRGSRSSRVNRPSQRVLCSLGELVGAPSELEGFFVPPSSFLRCVHCELGLAWLGRP